LEKTPEDASTPQEVIALYKGQRKVIQNQKQI